MCRWHNECPDSFVRKKEFSERNGVLIACEVNDFLNQFLIVLHGLSHKASDNVTVLVLPPMLVLSWGVSFNVSKNQNMKNVVFIKGLFLNLILAFLILRSIVHNCLLSTLKLNFFEIRTVYHKILNHIFLPLWFLIMSYFVIKKIFALKYQVMES